MPAPGLAKELPSNIDAERAILATVLYDSKTLPAVLEHLSPLDFFLPEHRVILRCMMTLSEAGESIDQITICEALASKRQLELAGGSPYVLSLSNVLQRLTPETLASHARIIRQKSQLREFIKASDKLQHDALEPNADLEHLHSSLRELSAKAASPAVAKVIGGNGHLSYSLDEFLAAEFPVPEHLVEGLIPRNGSVLIVAMPHHLKSWFTTSLALACTRAGENILGKLVVKKPVRTLLVQVEDFGSQLQWRIKQLVGKPGFEDCDRKLVRVIPRHSPPTQLPDERAVQVLQREVESFQAEHLILDVVRRIFKGDINNPQETADLLESIDRIRESTACTVTLVHHENRKEADIMYASAGSYNLPGWANSLIQFKRKTQQPDGSSHVEIEVDNKLAQSPEPMRMILDLGLDNPVRLESLEDTDSVGELREKLGVDWTVKDLSEALSVHKANGHRRLEKLIDVGIVEKLTSGRRGRSGRLARYKFVGSDDHLAMVWANSLIQFQRKAQQPRRHLARDLSSQFLARFRFHFPFA